MDAVGDTGCSEDWPDALKELRTLDSLLRCPICCELINTAMLVPKCSHTYCSLCIRRYSCFKSQCPTCAAAVSEPELLNNRLVDEIVSLFEQVRPALLQVVKGAVEKGVPIPEVKKARVNKVVPKVKEDSKSSSSSWTNIESKDARELKVKETVSAAKEAGRPFAVFSPSLSSRGSSSKRKYDVGISEFDDDFDDDVIVCGPAELKRIRTDESKSSLTGLSTPLGKKHQRTPSATMTPKSHSYSPSSAIMSPGSVATPTSTPSARKPTFDFQSPPFGASSSPSVSSPSTQTPNTGKKVPCPVCQVEIPERNINIHLDRCLTSSEKKDGLRSALTAPKRKLMPKLVYNLIKDGELRKKLTAVGLPTTGDRQTMISRHKEFTLIYNSECDSLNPRTGEEIAREMLRAEQSKQKQATMNPVSSLQIKKGASSDEVEKAQKDYVKKHKNQFADLIAETKRRMKEKRQKLNASASNAENAIVIDSKSEDDSSASKPESLGVEPLQTETTSSSASVNETGGASVGEITKQNNEQPPLPLQDNSSTVPHQEDSSNGSTELFCDQANDDVSPEGNNCDKNSLFVPNADEDSNGSNDSESLLSQAPPKRLESNVLGDAEAPSGSSISRVGPDLNDPISMSSPGIPADVLSQISDSNDIPLTQASKSSKIADDKNVGFAGMDKILENASQASCISAASSGSSRLNDDLSDYTPDLDDLQDSDNADIDDIPTKKQRPKRSMRGKKKENPVTTPVERTQRKSRGRSSFADKTTPSPSENIDINNLVDDPDFVDKPKRRLRTRKSKAQL